jgi:lysophospholipase L1-like esterase
MARRWWVLLLAALAALALACQAGAAGAPAPSGSATRTRTDLPSSMAALGDSISAGYGSCLALSACLRNSWSTGDGALVNSHYKRILSGNPAIRGHTHNLAEPGARASDLAAQASQAVTFKPDYVTVLIGANDACRSSIGDMTSTSEFRAGVMAALTTLRASLPNTRVLMVSIPDVYQVWQSAHTSHAATQIWALGVCPSLLANPTSTAPGDVGRRQAFRSRIDAYNQLLASACKEYGHLCRYDGGAVHAARISVDQLSPLDFFHPNAAGQSQLARVSYPSTFTW